MRACACLSQDKMLMSVSLSIQLILSWNNWFRDWNDRLQIQTIDSLSGSGDDEKHVF